MTQGEQAATDMYHTRRVASLAVTGVAHVCYFGLVMIALPAKLFYSHTATYNHGCRLNI